MSAAPTIAAQAGSDWIPFLFQAKDRQFVSRARGCEVEVDGGGVSVCGLRVAFEGANAKAAGTPESETSYFNEYLGADPSRWREHVPVFNRVRYREVYPGIDVVYYSRAGRLEYDFEIAAGGDPRRIRLSVPSGDRLAIDAEGNAAMGTVTLARPAVYQMAGDRRVPVRARYRRRGAHLLGIEVSRYDRRRPLVIDPVVYATYLGGSGADAAADLKLDASGNMIIAGSTNSPAFPQASGAANGTDALVVRLNATGTAVLFVTLIGGSGSDTASKVAVDPSGGIYILGSSGSTDFPYTAGAYRAAPSSAQGSFVAKLSPTGALLYSAQVQGSNATTDSVNALVADGTGRAIYGGATGTSLTATPGAYQTVSGGGADGFVAALNPAGSGLAFLTYLGGNFADSVTALALDASGNIVVGGQSEYSWNTHYDLFSSCGQVVNTFPITAGAYRNAYNCNDIVAACFGSVCDLHDTDSFAAKLNGTGSALLFSTYAPDRGKYGIGSVAADAAGNLYLTGSFRASPGFAAKMNAAGSSLLYSTDFNPANTSPSPVVTVNATTLSSAGGLVVAGSTAYADFPIDTTPATATPFVLQVDAQGLPVTSQTFSVQAIKGVAINNANEVVVAGNATAGQLTPTAGAIQAAEGGDVDLFVERLTLPTCNPTATITPQGFTSAGGNGSITITNSQGCLVAVTTGASWVTVSGPKSHVYSGSTSVSFTVAVNSGAAARIATLTAGPTTVTIAQDGTAGCSYSVNPASSIVIPPAGGSASIVVATTPDCGWSAARTGTWIIFGNTQGAGNGTVSFSVGANPGAQRTDTVTVGTQTITVTQAANNPLSIPALVSLNPFQGAGATAALTLVYSHPSGWAAIQSAEFIVNPRWESNSRGGGCYVKYAPAAGAFTLIADDGSSIVGTTTAGSATSLANSQCTLNAATSSATGSGNTLTIVASLTFSASFAGQRHIWMQAVDYNNLSTNWLVYGVWFPAQTSVTAGPWYRIYDPFSKSYLYSADQNEYNTLGSRGFTLQGVSGLVMNGATTVSGTPNIAWYRVFVNSTSSHMWTSDRNEFLTLVNQQQAYVGEGVAAFVMPYINAQGQQSPPVSNTVPFYRAAFQGQNLHFWTADADEFFGRNGKSLPSGYVGEGIACYIFPSTGAQGIGTAVPAPAPVPAVTEEDGRAAVVPVANGRGVAATDVIVPGQLLTIHGRHLGRQVLLNGAPLQVISQGENEIRVVVPAALTGAEAKLEMEHRGRRFGAMKLAVVSANPTILGANQFGKGNAEAQNEDGSANDVQHPASRGSVVTLFATGFSPRTTEAIEAHVGGRPAHVLSVRSSGARPGEIEVRIRVPDVGGPVDFQPVVLHIGETFSPPGVGLAIR